MKLRYSRNSIDFLITNAHYPIHNSPLRVLALNQTSVIHAISSYFFKTQFNNILPSTPRSSELSLPRRFPHRNSVWISLLSKAWKTFCPSYSGMIYFFKLQLGCHPVAEVQYTFTHKQYTERHKTNNTQNNITIFGRVRAVPSLCNFITLMTSGQQYNTMMHLQPSIAYKAKKIWPCM
jgi:hypothetical protein